MQKVGICAGVLRRANMRDQVRAIIEGGFGSAELGCGIGRNGCIVMNGRECAERHWDELRKIWAPIKPLTLHGTGPHNGGWVCGNARDNAYSLKVFTLQVRFAAAVGIQAIAIHDTNGGIMRQRLFLAASRENLKRQAEVAGRHGVLIGVENPTYGSHELMLQQIAAIDSPWVGFTIDTGHMLSYVDVYDFPKNARGINRALARTLKMLLPKCVDMHVHDVSFKRGDHACPGLGSIDWRMWARHVRAAGYAGPMQLEVGRFKNEPQLIAARRRLERLLAGK